MNGVILGVAAFDECVRFYRDKIGLDTLMEKPGLVCFRFGTMYLQIEDGPKFNLGMSQSVVLRENVTSVPEKQRELGARDISLEVHDLEWGKIGIVRDPHGTKIEYFQKKP